jgi:hypothetical protein
MAVFVQSLVAEDASKAVAAPAAANVDAIKAADKMEKTSSGEAKLAHATALKKESEDAAELEKMRADCAVESVEGRTPSWAFVIYPYILKC